WTVSTAHDAPAAIASAMPMAIGARICGLSRLARRILLAGFDPRLQDVLLRRQRAGREFAERARRVIGAVEIQLEGLVRRGLLLHIKEAARAVRRLAGGVILHDHEEAPVVVTDHVELVRLPLEGELHVT